MSHNLKGELVSFCGLSIWDCSLEHAVSELHKRLQNADVPMMLVTPNVDHLQRLLSLESPLFNASYSNADIVLCDSRVLRLLSTFSGAPLEHVVPGSDLTARLLLEDWVKGCPCAIIGPSDHDIRKIRQEFGLENMVGMCPPMGFIKRPAEVDACINFVIEKRPRIVFLAVGSPQQELLAAELKKRMDYGAVILCIGASFDFISGKVSRAPKWMQQLSLEWLYRALSEPKRLVPRYFRNFLFIVEYFMSGCRLNVIKKVDEV